MQSDDGTPHFAYFDKEHALSFVWDGRSTVVEVSVGGYGEMVSDVIRISANAIDSNSRPDQWLDWFQTLCATYVLLYKEGKE